MENDDISLHCNDDNFRFCRNLDINFKSRLFLFCWENNFIYAFFIDFFIFFVQDRTVRLSNIRLECSPKNKKVQRFFYGIFVPFHNTIYVIIPFICISIINTLTTISLRRHERNKHLKNLTRHEENLHSKSKKLAKLSLVLSTSFIAFTLPLAVYNVYYRFFTNDFLTSLVKKFLFEVFTLISSLNHIVNFILYCLFGKSFRKEMFLMFKTCFKRDHQLRRATTIYSINVDSSTFKI